MKKLFILICIILPGIIYGQGMHSRRIAASGGGASYTPEYQAVYDAMTTPPSSSVAEAQDDFVEYLTVTTTYWDSIDAMWVFAQESNGDGEALLEWKSGGVSNNATNVDATAFTSLEGFTGDGASDYINLNWNPTDDGSQYTQNDACMIGYFRTIENDDNNMLMGDYGSGNDSYLFWAGGTTAQLQVNAGNSDNPSATNAIGVQAFVRRTSTEMIIHINGTEASATETSTGLTSTDFQALCAGGVLASDAQVSLIIVGNGLSETAIENITTAFETYMDSNSKGIL